MLLKFEGYCRLGAVLLGCAALPAHVTGQDARWEQAISSGRAAAAARDYQNAQTQFEAALEMAEAWGDQDPRKAETLAQMARFFRSQGDFAKPEVLYRRALAAAAAAWNTDSVEYARHLNEVGRYYHARRKYAEAEQYYKQAFIIRVRHLGREHAEVADSISNLGVLYENRGLLDKAEVYYQHALTIRERVLGPNHGDTIVTIEHMARLLRRLQRAAAAEQLEARARPYREQRVLEAGGGGADRPEQVYRPREVRREPRLKDRVEPDYSEEARIARHEGSVVLEAVIGVDGRVSGVRLRRSLGLGLDERAVEAVRRWSFQPGRLGGQAVAVRTLFEINFRLL